MQHNPSKFGGKFFGSIAKRFSSCGESFTRDTPVATPNGEQAIGTLKVGDPVQSYDPATKKASTQTVQQVFINHDNDLIDVTLHTDAPTKTGKNVLPNSKQHDADVKSHGSLAPPSSTETVHTTQKHPWFTTNKGWITAGELQVGDHVQQLDGSTATVVVLHILPGEQDMYDLSVSQVHTFAVGNEQFVVHNCTNLVNIGAGYQAKQLGKAVPFWARGWTTVAVGRFEEGTFASLNSAGLRNSYVRSRVAARAASLGMNFVDYQASISHGHHPESCVISFLLKQRI